MARAAEFTACPDPGLRPAATSFSSLEVADRHWGFSRSTAPSANLPALAALFRLWPEPGDWPSEVAALDELSPRGLTWSCYS
jgi:hypothetical protein